MGAILIHGGTETSRKQAVEAKLKSLEIKIDENNPDLIIIETLEKKKSIGIDQAKQVSPFLSKKPFSHKNKVVIINKAELLTRQAQNALLKTLEEPPSYATIILNAKTENSLLETVISRCRKISAGMSDSLETEGPKVGEVLQMNTGEKLSWAGEYSKEDRVTVIETLENWVSQLRKNLSPAVGKNIEEIIKIKTDLEKTNVSLKLALENLVLKIK